MKAITLNGTELQISYTNAITAGYGHKKITIELCYEGNYKTFVATTNNMPDYDEAVDLDGEEKDEALFNLISYQIEDQVDEWIYEIEESND